jgi:chemotaxis signal transduction protein
MSASTNRMEAVWRRRADRLAQRPVAAGQSALRVMVLGLGNERYGIDLSDVAEVLPPVRITPVPGTSAVFAGVVNAHGEIRPVIDLRQLLGMEKPGMETAGDADPARVVLLRKDGIEIALLIDSVERIRSIGPADLQPEGMHSAVHGGAGLSQYVTRSTNDLLALLSTEALFAELRTGVTT